MACCLCSFPGSSRTWIALLVPMFAVFARFSSLLLLILLSALFLLLLLLNFSKQKPIPTPGKNQNPDQLMQENGIIVTSSSSDIDAGEEAASASASPPPASSSVRAETLLPTVEENGQDLYSESESMDQFSSTSTEDDDDDHSSDTEWRYNSNAGRQALDCSDDSISDEEGLIEIAIPSGQFVSPDKDSQFMNLKCCKQLSAAVGFPDHHPDKDPMFVHDQRGSFLAELNEMNEEDNLIEIDIYMGSIKLS